MKKFENPAIVIEKLNIVDVITTSGETCTGNTQLPEEEA